MKTIFASGVFLTLSLAIATAQYGATTVKSASTNAANRTGTSTNASAAKPASLPTALLTETNKPDIKELMEANEFTNSVGMVMVKLSPSLWASKYEVAQEEYQKIMGGNPSQFSGNRNPVDSVSWSDAMAFCQRLTENERKEELLAEGFSYTLPTQEQWESWAGSANLSDAIVSQPNRRNSTAAVGSLGPNAQGLYDVRGNVWEWCLDPQDKPFRVLRGAAWNSWIEVNLRVDFRWYSDGPDDKKNTFGFRCVMTSGK